MALYAKQIEGLMTIPGVELIVDWHLIAELGADMSVFADADHCASWAGLSPGSCESAGKQMSGRTRKGNQYLRRALTLGHLRGGAQDSDHRLLHSQRWVALPRVGRRLFRQAPSGAHRQALAATAGVSGPKRGRDTIPIANLRTSKG
jgi:transposase